MPLSYHRDVVGFFWNDMPHPTTWSWYIAVVPGNDMDVEMKDRLAGGSADVHAEVVAIGLVDLLDGGPSIGDRGHQLDAFRVGGLEP
jgi:hypothetical protein